MEYKVLLLPLISLAIAQAAKFLIESNKLNFKLKNLTSYSGMPSGHSALVVSLSTITGLEYGFSSPVFAISLILAIVIIRDAVGLRRYLGEHGKVLNKLVGDLDEDNMLDRHYPRLLEKIGHTPAQVLAGSAIGLIISLIGYLI